MNLVTAKEAAQSVFVSVAMVGYWVRKGKVKRHYTNDTKYFYLVDLDEVRQASKGMKGLIEASPPNLITRKEAAELLWVGENEISYYANMGYITKYHVLGNDYHYLVDRDEVRAQVKLIPQRIEARKPRLREHALSQPKDSRGWFLPTKP